MPKQFIVVDGDQRDDAVAVRAKPVDKVGLCRLAESRRYDGVDGGGLSRPLVAYELVQAAFFLKLIFGPSRGNSHSSALVWPGGSDLRKAGRAQMRS